MLAEAPDTLHYIAPLRDVTAIALIAALTWLSVRSAAAIGEAIIRPIRSIPPTICRHAAFIRRPACWRAR